MPHQDFFKDCRPQDTRSKVSNLVMYRGDTLSFQLFLTSNGCPLDISGGYFWFTVKEDINDLDSAAVISKELGNGINIINGPLGNLLITLAPADTDGLLIEESKSYYWDLQYQDSLGTVQTVFIGKLKILLEVTRNPGFNVGNFNILLSGSVDDGLAFVAGVNPVFDGDGFNSERQQVNVTGAIGGAFTLTVEDPNNLGTFETTTPIAWNDSAAAVKSALETDISFIDSVTVAGGPTLNVSPVLVVFNGPLIFNLDFPLMTMDVSALL